MQDTNNNVTALYDAWLAADTAYHGALVAFYGKANAGNARYASRHDDATVQAALARTRAAQVAYWTAQRTLSLHTEEAS